MNQEPNQQHNSHGHTRGGMKTRTFRSWDSMKDRCMNPNSTGYPRYGGTGITIDPRWLGSEGFRNFLSDMGERPEGMSLDRFPDKYGGYGPANCRWATRAMQAQNRRPRMGTRVATTGENRMKVSRKYDALTRFLNETVANPKMSTKVRMQAAERLAAIYEQAAILADRAAARAERAEERKLGIATVHYQRLAKERAQALAGESTEETDETVETEEESLRNVFETALAGKAGEQVA